MVVYSLTYVSLTQSIENVVQMREAALKKKNKDLTVFKANEWLKENAYDTELRAWNCHHFTSELDLLHWYCRDKFEHRVFPPLHLLVDVHDQRNSKYVEDVLSKNEVFTTFFTQSREDSRVSECDDPFAVSYRGVPHSPHLLVQFRFWSVSWESKISR